MKVDTPFLITMLMFLCLGVINLASAQHISSDISARLDQAVGNIAFTDKSELVFSHHPFFKPDIRVAKYDKNTKKVIPFPNVAWNTPKMNNDLYLDDVLGIRNDDIGIVWMLDMGTRNSLTPKLVGWNTQTNSLERIYYIPVPASTQTSQLNDFVIDRQHGVFVIADEDIARGGDGSNGALVLVHMKTGKTQRVLDGHQSTKADKASPIVINKVTMSVDDHGERKPVYIGADGITLDKNNEWLYYAPLNGNKLYRVKMTDLLNESLDDEALGQRIETYSSKPNNGGLSIDSSGNLYCTNIESKSIGLIAAKDKKYSVLTSHDQMLWPDGISYNNDGYMYVSAAQVYLGAPFNNGEDKTSPPFYIFRFKPLADGIFGR